MTNLSEGRWRHYWPAAICIGLALIFFLIPPLAVFVVVGLLLAVGFFYAAIVYQVHRALDQGRTTQWHDIIVDTPDSGGRPSFKGVSVYMVRKSGFFDEP